MGIIASIPQNLQCDFSSRNLKIDTASKKNIYFKVAENTANWLASLAVEDPYGAIKWPWSEGGSWYSIGLDMGATGIGRFFLELYEVNPDISYLQYAEGAGRYISQHGYEGVQLDWLGGPGAAGSFFFDLYRTTGNTFYLQEAEKAGDWIIAKHYEENEGYYWIPFLSLPDRIYTSWAHGAAGLGAFLAELYEATGNIEYLDAAKKAAT